MMTQATVVGIDLDSFRNLVLQSCKARFQAALENVGHSALAAMDSGGSADAESFDKKWSALLVERGLNYIGHGLTQ
jgi:hypothetical protein